jgi:hypothetical protein
MHSSELKLDDESFCGLNVCGIVYTVLLVIIYLFTHGLFWNG